MASQLPHRKLLRSLATLGMTEDLRLAALQPAKRRLNRDERRHAADHHRQSKADDHLDRLARLAERLGD